MTYKTCFSPNKKDTVYILHTLHKSRYTLDTGHTTNTCIPSMNCIMLFPHTYTHTHYSAYKKYSKACSTYTTSYIAYIAIMSHGANTQCIHTIQHKTLQCKTKQHSTNQKQQIVYTYKKYLHRYICNLYDVRQGCATLPYLVLFVLHYMHRCIPMYILFFVSSYLKGKYILIYNE